MELPPLFLELPEERQTLKALIEAPEAAMGTEESWEDVELYILHDFLALRYLRYHDCANDCRDKRQGKVKRIAIARNCAVPVVS